MMDRVESVEDVLVVVLAQPPNAGGIKILAGGGVGVHKVILLDVLLLLCLQVLVHSLHQSQLLFISYQLGQPLRE